MISTAHRRLRFVYAGVQVNYFLVLAAIIIRLVCLKISIIGTSCQENECKRF